MKVRGIMFYGFAAAILTGTAHAAATPFTIASQAYVDGQVTSAISTAAADATSKVNTLANGAVATNTSAIAAINNESTGILKQAKDYADGIVSGENGLVTRVAANESAISAINNESTGILKQAKDYADTKASAAQSAAEATAAADATSKVNALANGAVAQNTSDIAAINNAQTGIAAVAATDATNKANAAESAAKDYADGKFGGGTNVKSLPAYSTCTADSGKCVLTIDKTSGALTWVDVTSPLESNN